MLDQLHYRNMEARIPFGEDGDNGLVLNDKYLPEELIAEILCNVDCDTLLHCQLVCARWKMLIETYVWRRKAERICCRSLHSVKDVHWIVYYAICTKQPFEQNLVKNCSGQNGLEEHWRIVKDGGDQRKVESPPAGVSPLPTGVWPFERGQCCFVTSFQECSKEQIIYLILEGLTSHLLDTLQPPIEHFVAQGEGVYECCVKLLGDQAKVLVGGLHFSDYIRFILRILKIFTMPIELFPSHTAD